MNRTLSEVANAVGGMLHGIDATYASVSTDTRTIARDDLFVALRGPNFDGNDFVGAAAKAGACAAVVTRRVEALAATGAQLPQVVVNDGLVALTELARRWRAQFSFPVVGVGGANGKTTVKGLIAAILGRSGPCLATRGNLNNHIGVPLTLMRLDATHRSAVIEMGANRIGDVAQLCAIARPTVGVITNAGAEHLEGFGSLDGVAQGEGEMVVALDAQGVAVINADDPYADLWRRMSRAGKVLTFGLSAAADFRATDISQSIGAAGFVLSFTLHAQRTERAIRLQLAGRHNVINALAAAAAAHAAGASLDDIAAGLAEVEPVGGRLQLKVSRHGAWIIDDSYNANPSSVEAALHVLKELQGPRWMVLGDMGELGTFAQQSHLEAGVLARRCGVARLFAMGPMSAHAAEAFGAGAEWFTDAAALIRRLDGELQAGTTVLIKGSRSNRLERVVESLGAPPAKHH